MGKEPSFRKNRKKIIKVNSKEEINPFKMDEILFNMITNCIKNRKFKLYKDKIAYVNKLMPGKKKLWDDYHKFLIYFEPIIKKQKLLDQINEHIDDMENAKNFALVLIKKSKEKRTKGGAEEKNNPYQIQFDFLDSHIEDIEVLIYLGVSPVRICKEMNGRIRRDSEKLNPIIFHRWSDETTHNERLGYAAKASAENYIHLGKDFLLEWLDPVKHPELDMQHVGIVREVSLYYSRMAEFMNRKKYGRKVEIVDDRPQKKYIEGKNLMDFINAIDVKAGEINQKEEQQSEEDEMGEGEESDEEGFTSFEEIKD